MLVVTQLGFGSAQHTERVHFGIILYVQIGLKLIFRTNVQLAEFGIQADNRSKSPTRLAAIKINADEFGAGGYRSSCG